MYQLAYQRSIHGIGMMNTQAIANTSVRHNTSSPLALKMTSRRVPEMLRQIQRVQAVATQAQPMIVMNESKDRSLKLAYDLAPWIKLASGAYQICSYDEAGELVSTQENAKLRSEFVRVWAGQCDASVHNGFLRRPKFGIIADS